MGIEDFFDANVGFFTSAVKMYCVTFPVSQAARDVRRPPLPSRTKRMMKSGVIRTLLLCGAIPVLFSLASARPLPGDTLRLGLAAAIDRAIEVSPEVATVAAGRDFAAARSSLARASRYLTEFKATSIHAPGPGLKNLDETPTDQLYLNPDVRNDWSKLRPFNRVEVEILQPLYTWGELGGNIRAARYGVEVEEAAVRGKESEVARRAGELYYNVLLTEALYRVASDAGEAVAKARKEIEKLLAEGSEDVDEADRFQVLIAEQDFKRQLVEIEQKRLTARVALTRMLFLPDSTIVVPEDATLDAVTYQLDPLEGYQREAMTHRSEIDQAAAGLAARKALVDVARSDYFPKLFLGVSFKASALSDRFRQRNPFVSDPFLSNGLQAGLGMRMKLNYFQTRARVEQARAQYDEVRYRQTGLNQLVLFEVEEAYRKVITTRSAYQSRMEALKISKEWLRTEQINFDLEIGNTDNLIKAVQTNLLLQAAAFEAIQKYDVAVLNLLQTTGTLPMRARSGTLVD